MTNPLVGDTIDKYKIIDIIGKGATATVYKVQHIYLEKIFALKVLSPKLISETPDIMQRFLEEAKNNVRLSHENLVKAVDVEKGEEYTYMVMEFIDGYTLEDFIKKLGSVPPLSSIKIILEVCKILQFAFEQKFIHRDIKPGNIMITKDSNVKLADYGLAKLVTEPDKYKTSSGVIYGTPFYMSPEQFINSENIDHRSDLYSLGASFYHILTGRVPFETTDLKELIHKKLNDTPHPPSYFNKNINAQLDLVLMKLLMKDPEKRCQDYSDLVKDLKKLAAVYRNKNFEKSNAQEMMEKYQRYQQHYNRFEENSSDLISLEDREKEELNRILENISTNDPEEEFMSSPGLLEVLAPAAEKETLNPEVSDRLQQKYLKYLDKSEKEPVPEQKVKLGPVVANISPPMLKNSSALKTGEVKLSKATTGNLQEKFTDFDKQKVKVNATTYIGKFKNLFKK